MYQLICPFLSHTRYWYEVGMLKVVPDILVQSSDNSIMSVALILYDRCRASINSSPISICTRYALYFGSCVCRKRSVIGLKISTVALLYS